MNKKAGWVSAIGGIISSVLGFIAACMLFAPVCGGICIAGPLAAIFGIGIAGFLHKYSIWFIVLGGIFFILGIFLIVKNRKSCTMGNIENYLRRLKKWYKVEKCKTCDCFQGALTQLDLDTEDEKIKKKIRSMIISKAKMHGCLGCEPCQPAEIFSSYIKSSRHKSHNIKTFPRAW